MANMKAVREFVKSYLDQNKFPDYFSALGQAITEAVKQGYGDCLNRNFVKIFRKEFEKPQFRH